jgi:hypothetical protein
MAAARAGLLAVTIATAAVAGACTDAGTSSPNAVVAIAFDTLPFPAVVAQDTMRDTLGRAAALHAVAYNSDGKVIANPVLRYLALDTGVVIDGSGYLIANTRTSGPVRIVATAGLLQSVTRTIQVTRAPTRLTATSATDTTIPYSYVDNASVNISGPLAVKMTGDSSGTAIPTVGFLVSYRVLFQGAARPANDTIQAVWDDASHVGVLDTTSTDGTASRKLRIFSAKLPVTNDSFVVMASASWRGAPVAGSPIRFVIHFLPKSAR